MEPFKPSGKPPQPSPDTERKRRRKVRGNPLLVDMGASEADDDQPPSLKDEKNASSEITPPEGEDAESPEGGWILEGS